MRDLNTFIKDAVSGIVATNATYISLPDMSALTGTPIEDIVSFMPQETQAHLIDMGAALEYVVITWSSLSKLDLSKASKVFKLFVKQLIAATTPKNDIDEVEHMLGIARLLNNIKFGLIPEVREVLVDKVKEFVATKYVSGLNMELDIELAETLVMVSYEPPSHEYEDFRNNLPKEIKKVLVNTREIYPDGEIGAVFIHGILLALDLDDEYTKSISSGSYVMITAQHAEQVRRICGKITNDKNV